MGRILLEQFAFLFVPAVCVFHFFRFSVGRDILAIPVKGHITHPERFINRIDVGRKILIHGNLFLQLRHTLFPKPGQGCSNRGDDFQSLPAMSIFRIMDEGLKIFPIFLCVDIGNESRVIMHRGDQGGIEQVGDPFMKILP